MIDFPPKGLDDNMGFGQYPDDELWQVIQNDVQYVRWLIEDADMHFELDNEAFEYYQSHLKEDQI